MPLSPWPFRPSEVRACCVALGPPSAHATPSSFVPERVWVTALPLTTCPHPLGTFILTDWQFLSTKGMALVPEDTAPLQLHAKSSARFRQGPGDADMEEVTTANRKLFHREDRGGWPGSSLAMVPHTTSRRGGENCPSLPAQNQPVPTLIGVHMGPCQLDIPIVMSSTKSDKP